MAPKHQRGGMKALRVRQERKSLASSMSLRQRRHIEQTSHMTKNMSREAALAFSEADLDGNGSLDFEEVCVLNLSHGWFMELLS